MYQSAKYYLQTILSLEKRYGTVRSVDVARELNYSKASVSRGMTLLRNHNYIFVDEKGFLQFTKDGRMIAENIYEKYQILTSFFMFYAEVDREKAEVDACKVEHIISQETYEGIKRCLENNIDVIDKIS